ncbi:MAG: hypothetical protein RBR67_21350, partial [Desulfobacterium sp.]|nr:hypothetical protein [Desulfobacterium sp.]
RIRVQKRNPNRHNQRSQAPGNPQVDLQRGLNHLKYAMGGTKTTTERPGHLDYFTLIFYFDHGL